MESFGAFLRHLNTNLKWATIVVVCVSVVMTFCAMIGAGMFWLSSLIEPTFGLWTPLLVLAAWAVASVIILTAAWSAIDMLK